MTPLALAILRGVALVVLVGVISLDSPTGPSANIMVGPGGAGGGGGQTITGVSLSSSSFTGGAADGTTVGTITVSMSSGSFSGTLTLTGTQTGSGNDKDSFRITSGSLLTNTAGGATDQPGQYAICIVASGSYSNSPQQTCPTIQATGTGGAGWQAVFTDEFACPNNMLECTSIVSASAFTWASSFCSGLSSPSATGCGTLTVASLPTNITSADCTGSKLGACDVSIAGATNGGAGGDAAVNGTFLVAGVPDSTHINLYMPYSGINTTLGGTITVGSGPWTVALTSSCSSGPCTGLPLLGSNDNTGEAEAWDPHSCTVSGGQLVMNHRNTSNYTPPAGMQVSGNGYTGTMCHISAWDGSRGFGQAQEVYFDYDGKLPAGGVHTSLWGLSTSNIWSSGPEVDVPECFNTGFCQWHIFPSGATQSLAAVDYSATSHQFGVDLSNSAMTFFLNGTQDFTDPNGNTSGTVWYPMIDSALDAGANSLVYPTTSTWRHVRVYKHVGSAACYSSIPTHATVPHTGTC